MNERVFQVTIRCKKAPAGFSGDASWQATVNEFRHVFGYADNPVSAICIAAEAAAELWFNDGQRPPPVTAVEPI